MKWICADPEVSAGFGGVVSYHSYWSDRIPDQLVPDREPFGQAMQHYPGWKIWQTEYCVMERGRELTMDTALRVARIIDCDLTLVNASAISCFGVVGESMSSDQFAAAFEFESATTFPRI